MYKNKAHLEGHGVRYDNYYNPEGYADPTAGCAINGNCEIYAAPVRRLPGEKEKVVTLDIPPVSELEAFLNEIGYSIRDRKDGFCARRSKKQTRRQAK